MEETYDKILELVYAKNLTDLKEEVNRLETPINDLVDSSGYTFLHHIATVEDSEEIIEFLIEKGIEINKTNLSGCSPLLESVKYGCPNNLASLIKLGADPTLANDDKQTPMQQACGGDYLACIKVMVKNGISVNDHGGTKYTPLNYAIVGEVSLELIQYLLDQGADVNLGDGFSTPLMSAIANEDLEMIQFLIGNGAKIKGPKNINGEEAIDFAKRVENEEIVKYLIENTR